MEGRVDLTCSTADKAYMGNVHRKDSEAAAMAYGLRCCRGITAHKTNTASRLMPRATVADCFEMAHIIHGQPAGNSIGDHSEVLRNSKTYKLETSDYGSMGTGGLGK